MDYIFRLKTLDPSRENSLPAKIFWCFRRNSLPKNVLLRRNYSSEEINSQKAPKENGLSEEIKIAPTRKCRLQSPSRPPTTQRHKTGAGVLDSQTIHRSTARCGPLPDCAHTDEPAPSDPHRNTRARQIMAQAFRDPGKARLCNIIRLCNPIIGVVPNSPPRADYSSSPPLK